MRDELQRDDWKRTYSVEFFKDSGAEQWLQNSVKTFATFLPLEPRFLLASLALILRSLIGCRVQGGAFEGAPTLQRTLLLLKVRRRVYSDVL